MFEQIHHCIQLAHIFQQQEYLQFPVSFLKQIKSRCFEVTLRKFQVQIGAQGTDDDVRVKVRYLFSASFLLLVLVTRLVYCLVTIK